MALMQLAMIPIGEGIGVGKFVAAIQTRLEEENATFHLNDMGTLIEGDIQTLFKLLSKIYEIPFENGAIRVVTNITIDDRRDKTIHIGDKIEAVKKRRKK
jgi:uncharacterized protein (TIGR00106 family)